MEKIACLYWTIDTQEHASALIQGLIDKKLIACANILPGVSMYPWQGTVHREQEYFVICKTSTEKIADAVAFVEQAHTYDIPCITSWVADAGNAYAGWVTAVTGA